MSTIRKKLGRAVLIGMVLFAAVALSACSDDQEERSTTNDEATISDDASVEITRGDSSPSVADTASISDSASAEINRSTTTDSATITETVDVLVNGAGGSGTNDTAKITDSVVTAKLSPQSGGAASGSPGGDNTFLTDSVTFVIRNSDGVVVNQGIVR